MNSSPLKECPFCGDSDDLELEKVDKDCWAVGCLNCDFTLNSGDSGIGWHKTRNAAIKAWNTRKGKD